MPSPCMPALCKTKTPIVVAIVPRSTMQSKLHSNTQGIVARTPRRFKHLNTKTAVMEFQSFQSKRGIIARKGKPRNGAMTGYSGGCTVGPRNNTLKRRQFQSRVWRGV